MSKTYTYFIALVGVACTYFLVRLFFFADLSSRTVQSDALQGILIGFGLAVVTVPVYRQLTSALTKTNGWTTM